MMNLYQNVKIIYLKKIILESFMNSNNNNEDKKDEEEEKNE